MMTPEWPHPEDVFLDPDATDEQLQEQYAKDKGMLPEWADPINHPPNDAQLRELAVTVAANVPCGNIEELLDNADKVQKYLATGQRDETDETAAQPL